MAKVSNKELLEIAENVETSAEQLNRIWDISKSIKVRKAVASNPNADPITLRKASRLYIEEVVENPGFEMLKLFDEDEWIKRIGEIYEDPDNWSRGYYYARRTEQVEPFARVALLSENLLAPHLNSILEFLPTASLKRAFKYPKTREKARRLLISGASKTSYDFSLESLFKLYGSDVISEGELYEMLRNISYVGCLSCRKSIYVRAIKSLFKAVDEDKENSSKALAMILLASRASCLKWIEYSFEKKHLKIIASAILTAKRIKKKAGHGVSVACKTTIQMLSGIVIGLLWEPLDFWERRQNLGELYKALCKLGLENHEWGDTKMTWRAVQLTNEMCEDLLKEDIKVQAFYARSKSLGTWFHVQKSSAKYQVIERVNNWLYERGGIENVLYKEISLKKVITISDDVVIGY